MDSTEKSSLPAEQQGYGSTGDSCRQHAFVSLEAHSPSFITARETVIKAAIDRSPKEAVKSGKDEVVRWARLSICAGSVSLAIGTLCVLGVKVAAYSVSQSWTVKISMFDAVGEAISGILMCITQRKMKRSDVTKFPSGKGRLEPVGVLVYTVFMTALLTCQMIGAGEQIAAVEEPRLLRGMQMFSRGHFAANVWDPRPFVGTEGVYDALQFALRSVDPVLAKSFRDRSPETVDWSLVDMKPEDRSRALDDKMEHIAQLVEVGQIHSRFQSFKVTLLLIGSAFLVKGLLAIFNRKIVYSRSRSPMVLAYAREQEGDCLMQVFVAMVITAVYLGQGSLGWADTRLDPLCSCLLAAVIIYKWISMALEQLTYLTGYAAEAGYYEEIAKKALDVLKVHGSCCELNAIKAYHFGQKHIVELHAVLTDQDTPYTKLAGVISALRHAVEEIDTVERAFVSLSTKK